MIASPLRFAAPWSRSLVATTIGIGALVIGIAAVVVAALWRMPAAAAATAAVTIVPVALAWALAPRGFTIDANQLTVERPLWPLRLPRADIRSARALDAGEARRLGLAGGGALRTFGTSGLFGYYGRFRSAALGSFRMYATRRTGFVLVDTRHGPVVLTPDDPEGMCAGLREQSGR